MEGEFLNRLSRSNLVETELTEGVEASSERSEWTFSADSADSVSTDEGVPSAVVNNPPDGTRFREKAVSKHPIIWAVGGGKGGVGKSLISANFALSLAKKGRRVVAVDLDLGGSNLHTCLGVEPPVSGIGDWASGRNADLEQLMVPGGEQGLMLISGSQDPLGIVEIMEKRQVELLEGIRALAVDDVILDLGAGTHDLTVTFFNLADRGIISVLPEPTSVENAYRFIRAVIFRRFQGITLPSGIREVIDASMDPKNMLGIKTPGDLLAVVDRLQADSAAQLREALHKIDLSVVINQVRSPVDVDVGRAICSVCRRYFGMEVKYAGYLDYDSSVWKSVRSRKAVLREYPHSVLANRIERLTRTLLGEERGLFP